MAYEAVTKARLDDAYEGQDVYRPLWVAISYCLVKLGLLVSHSKSTHSESVYLSVSDGVSSVSVRVSCHAKRSGPKVDFDFRSDKALGAEQCARQIAAKLRSAGMESRKEYRRKNGRTPKRWAGRA